MRNRTRENKSSVRIALTGSKPRNPVVQAVINGFGMMSGKRHANERRAKQLTTERQRFDLLDYDQKIRQVGEW